jgi:F0F1-type ATP synthase gamma subunit
LPKHGFQAIITHVVAMKSASDNAKVIGDLKLIYNKARQRYKEISEIVGGAAAVS